MAWENGKKQNRHDQVIMWVVWVVEGLNPDRAQEESQVRVADRANWMGIGTLH